MFKLMRGNPSPTYPTYFTYGRFYIFTGWCEITQVSIFQ